jgi:amidohydrolase
LGADLIPGLHSPEMTFDRKALPIGAEILVKAVMKKLN